MSDRRGTKKSGGLTGAVLKKTACLTMFVDHFFAILFLGYMNLHPVNGGRDPRLESIYRVGRAVGRVSFVLFAFLIVEGFVHTKSRARYLLRLGVFALLSELPFDLAFSGKIFDWTGQNIYWTLFLGVLVLTLWEYLGAYLGESFGAHRNRLSWSGKPPVGCRAVFWIVRLMVVAAGCGAAFFFSTDYRYMGVLLIFTFYLTRKQGVAVQFLTAGCVMLLGTFSANCIRYADRFTIAYLFRFSLREMYGLFAFLLIAAYSGERGKQLPKLFYYGFYPAHLLFLYGIARLTGIM